MISGLENYEKVRFFEQMSTEVFPELKDEEPQRISRLKD